MPRVRIRIAPVPSAKGSAKLEYLIVELIDRDGRPRSRRVRIDGEFLGQTDEHYFELERGTHTVTLGPPANFSPETRRVRLRNTNPITPRSLRFDVV